MRAVLAVFENYQKARVNFVQTVAELATRPQNIEALQNAGVMQLLRPLLGHGRPGFPCQQLRLQLQRLPLQLLPVRLQLRGRLLASDPHIATA